MALGRFAPTVTIGGQQLPESYDPAGVVGLDGFAIVWGREDIYALNEPAVLTLNVIDTSGSWGASSALIGTEIRIMLPDDGDRLVFRGRIAAVSMSRISAAGAPAWNVEISATDVIGDLAREIAYNRGEWQAGAPYPDGPGGWPVKSRSNIAPMLLDGGLARWVSAVESIPATVTGQYNSNASRPISISEKMSWLDILHGWYRQIPFAIPQYHPPTHSIAIGLPAPSNPALVLEWIAGVIELIADAGTTSTVVIPARSMEYVSTPELTATVTDAITGISLNVVETWNGSDGVPFLHSATVVAAVPGMDTRGGQVAQIDLSSTIGGFRNAGETVSNNAAYLDQSIAGYLAAIATINDRMTMPRLRYVLDDHAPDDVIDALMLSTYMLPLTLYFAGSELAGIPNVPAGVQIIGGTLEWASGWEATVTVATAAGGGSAPIVSIAELVPASATEPEFQDYAPTITLGDLGTVTRGVI